MGLMSYRAFAVYFRVDSLPAFVFIDREGKPVQRVSGYWSADMFGPLLDYMQGEVYKRNIAFEEYLKELKR
jgi:thioredoxin-related protein